MIYQQLKDIIKQSKIEERDKELWYEFIRVANEEQITSVLEVLESNPEHLDFLTKNLRNSINLVQGKGDKSVEEIVEEQAKYIEDN